MRLPTLKSTLRYTFFLWAVYITYIVSGLNNNTHAIAQYRTYECSPQASNLKSYNDAKPGNTYEVKGFRDNMQFYVKVMSVTGGDAGFFLLNNRNNPSDGPEGYISCREGDRMIGARTYTDFSHTLQLDVLCCKVRQT